MANFKDLVRVGQDATVNQTSTGKVVLSFSAAFDDGWGENKTSHWLRISGWGERYSKLEPYIKKGSQLVVEGNLGSEEYQGKTNLKLTLTDIKLVSKGSGGGSSGSSHVKQKEPPRKKSPEPEFDDDIPF